MTPQLEISFKNRICRGCACTDNEACPGGCSWALLDIASPSGMCTFCAQEMDWDLATLARGVCQRAAETINRWWQQKKKEQAS